MITFPYLKFPLRFPNYRPTTAIPIFTGIPFPIRSLLEADRVPDGAF